MKPAEEICSLSLRWPGSNVTFLPQLPPFAWAEHFGPKVLETYVF